MSHGVAIDGVDGSRSRHRDVPRWVLLNSPPKGAIHGTAYHHRHRSGEEHLPGARRERRWARCAASAAAPGPGSNLLLASRSVPDRDGGLLRCASLGAGAFGARPRGAAHAGGIREAVCKARQDRQGGRGGDLRSGDAADDALRAGEVGGGSGGAARPQGAGLPHPPADPDREHDPCASRRVRDRGGEGYPECRPAPCRCGADARGRATRPRPAGWPAPRSARPDRDGHRAHRSGAEERPARPTSRHDPRARTDCLERLRRHRPTSRRSAPRETIPPGSGSRRSPIRAAARSGSGGSRRLETVTCDACSTSAPWRRSQAGAADDPGPTGFGRCWRESL